MSCCNKVNDREIPEDIEPCCGSMKGKRCFCLPYDDAHFITAQILAIVAFLISWVFWGAFIVSGIGLTLLQIPWCCRQNAAVLYGTFAAAVLSALSSIGVGIYVMVVFKDKRDCYAWDLSSWGIIDEYPNGRVYCQYKVWATIAFVCAALWVAAAGLLLYFVTSGRHAQWEKKHSAAANEDDDDDNQAVAVELGTVPQPEGATPAIDTAVVVSAPEESLKEDVND